MLVSKLVGGGKQNSGSNATGSNSDAIPTLAESEKIITETLQIIRECTALINSIPRAKASDRFLSDEMPQSAVDRLNALLKQTNHLEVKMRQYPGNVFDLQTAEALAPKYRETLKEELENASSLSWSLSRQNTLWTPTASGLLSNLDLFKTYFWSKIAKTPSNKNDVEKQPAEM